MTDALSGDYWRAVLERLVKTLVQAAGGFALTLATALIASPAGNVFDVDWRWAVGTALYSALLSLVTSLASTYLGRSRGPSLAGEVLVSERARPRPVPGAPRHRAPDTDDGGATRR